MPCPPETASAQNGVHVFGLAEIQDGCVRDLISPGDTQYAAQTSEVKAVKAVFLPSVCRPGFAPVQQDTEDTCLVNFSLHSKRDVLVVPDPFLQSTKR